ncbi:hypothetical protein MMC21_005758 [Puttea exsequens]|nr:hypothetical protein [Puttea exsequens]
MALGVDPNIPTKLAPELLKKVDNKIKRKHDVVRRAPLYDPLVKTKKQVDAALHRKKNNGFLEKARKQRSRNADTSRLEAQCAHSSIIASDEDIKPPAPRQYDDAERGEIVRLTCEPVLDPTEYGEDTQRLETIRTHVALCDRQESRHRARSLLIHL